MQLIIGRTDLVQNRQLITELDQKLAARLTNWSSWSRQRIIDAIDAAVLAVDPDAAKQRRRKADDERFVYVDPLPEGMAQVFGHVPAADGAALGPHHAVQPYRSRPRRADGAVEPSP